MSRLQMQIMHKIILTRSNRRMLQENKMQLLSCLLHCLLENIMQKKINILILYNQNYAQVYFMIVQECYIDSYPVAAEHI